MLSSESSSRHKSRQLVNEKPVFFGVLRKRIAGTIGNKGDAREFLDADERELARSLYPFSCVTRRARLL